MTTGSVSPQARGPALCRLDEMVDGQARGFDPWRAGRDTVFVVRHDGEVRAWRDDCPHVPGSPLAWRKDAYLSGDRRHIVCHAHGARFDPVTGTCLIGPCLGQRLTPVPIEITPDGDLRITPEERQETFP